MLGFFGLRKEDYLGIFWGMIKMGDLIFSKGCGNPALAKNIDDHPRHFKRVYTKDDYNIWYYDSSWEKLRSSDKAIPLPLSPFGAFVHSYLNYTIIISCTFFTWNAGHGYAIKLSECWRQEFSRGVWNMPSPKKVVNQPTQEESHSN